MADTGWEQDVVFRRGQDRLVGTIAVPRVPVRCPAVVLLQGSGGEDRSNSGHFTPIRQHVLRSGVAVFWYDRPGVGGSSGDWRTLGLRDRAEEALAASAAVRSCEAVDPGRVGLYGHSQGGWVAPLAATMSADVAFVVAVSGPGVTPAEQGVYAVERGMRSDGWDAGSTAAAVDLIREAYAAASRGEPFGRVESLLDEARSAPWFTALPRYVPLPDAGLWRSATLPDPVTGRVFLDHDPVPVLEATRCPVLAVFGEHDPVLPVDRSVAAYRAALARRPVGDAEVVVVPSADHRLRVGSGVPPAILDRITEWIVSRS